MTTREAAPREKSGAAATQRAKAKSAISAFAALTAALAVLVPPALAAVELDESFSGDGRVITALGVIPPEFASASIATDVAVGASNRTVAAFSGGPFAGLVRYQPNGELDESLAGDGMLLFGETDIFDKLLIEAIAVQSDGKIVVVGPAARPVDVGPRMTAVARFTPEGAPDTSFSGDGLVTTDLPGSGADVADVAVTPEGEVVLAGDNEADFAAVRYEADGELDRSFSGDGIAVARRTAGVQTAGGMSLQDDGKLLVAGSTLGRKKTIEEDAVHLALARFTAGGRLDRSFAGDGLAKTRFRGSSFADDVAVQPNGRIVAAGSDARYRGGPGPTDIDFAAVRYRKDGRLDRTFSNDGRRTLAFARRDDAWDKGYAVGVLSGRRLALAGGSTGGFAVAVLRGKDGALARSFGRKGKLITNFGDQLPAEAYSLAVHGDGRFVLAGIHGGMDEFGGFKAGDVDLALARYDAVK